MIAHTGNGYSLTAISCSYMFRNVVWWCFDQPHTILTGPQATQTEAHGSLITLWFTIPSVRLHK